MLRASPVLLFLLGIGACTSVSAPASDAGPPVPAAEAGPGVDGSIDASRAPEPDQVSLEAGVDDGSAPLPVRNPRLPAACRGRSRPGRDVPLPRFEKRTLASVPGAGYLLPRDLDNDGAEELLVSALTEGLDLGQLAAGPPLAFGGAYLLRPDGLGAPGTLPTYTVERVFDRAAQIAWPNASSLLDVDNDGRDDWVIGAGFLVKPTGALIWMKANVDGTFGLPVRFETPDPLCWYHEALPLDMDGDGDVDFVTTCHVGSTSNFAGPSRLEWFENPGDASGAFTHHALGAGGGALLTLFDVDGDGDEDILAPQFFEDAPLVWFERTQDLSLTRHVISSDTGRGFVVRLADVNGDDRTDIVFGNHNNEIADDPTERTMGIYWFEVPPATELEALPNWNAYRHTVYEGFEVLGDGNGASAGAPGMLNVGDLDGDCDIDISASGDGDPGLYVFVQGSTGFMKLDLDRDPNNVNSGEQHMRDLDGDGDTDLVWAVFGPNDPALLLSTGLGSRVYAFLNEGS